MLAAAVLLLAAGCGGSSTITDSTYPTASAWIEHHFPPGFVNGPENGVVSGPHHTQQVFWRLGPQSVTITVGGRPVKLAKDTFVFVTINAANSTYIGPVYFGRQKATSTWHVLTRHPHT